MSQRLRARPAGHPTERSRPDVEASTAPGGPDGDAGKEFDFGFGGGDGEFNFTKFLDDAPTPPKEADAGDRTTEG